MRKLNSGITLIALIISIIVLLILAGVSINALVGENGIISQAMNASFLSEMTAVQESYDLWKTNHYDDAEIPVSGLVQRNDIEGKGRLYGEIAYYRSWTDTGEKPAISVKASVSEFNNVYGGEITYIPRGVEDLYYLNNEELGIDTKGKYIIDASNSMIYSIDGYSMEGVDVHSLAMYQAVNGNSSFSPSFTVAEVTGGSGDGIPAAGNTDPEYYTNEQGQWTDKNGNVVSTKEEAKNETYNPYGFKIIASSSSENIFKLYNNGDLYGKGKKGIQLNTSKVEMDAINPYVWKKFSVPSTIGAYKKLYSTEIGLFLIDNNNDVWSYGSNHGLQDYQRVEYTGRSWVKLDLGKDSQGNDYKVSKVFGTTCSLYLVTTSNVLLGTGVNEYGQLGTGDSVQRTTFVEISGIPDPSKIETIFANNYSNEGGNTVIKYVDPTETDPVGNHFYFCGKVGYGDWGYGLTKGFTCNTFTEIYKGVAGQGNDIRNTLNNIFVPNYERILLWFNTGEVSYSGWNQRYVGGVWNVPEVVDVRYSSSLTLLKCNNNGNIEYWGTNGTGSTYGIVQEQTGRREAYKINIPDGVTITDFQIGDGTGYFLTSTNEIYAIGCRNLFGVTDYETNVWSYTLEKLTTISGITAFFGSEFGSSLNEHGLLFLNKNGEYYIIGNSNVMYGDDVLQRDWTLVASNVDYFDARYNAYVTKDHNVYVAGSDSRILGLGTDSETKKTINNYVQITQAEIAGKAKEVYQYRNATYIITVDNDLYATGLATNDGGKHDYMGWEYKQNGSWVYEDKTTYVKIFENVKYFFHSGGYPARAIVTTDSKYYLWGAEWEGPYLVAFGVYPGGNGEIKEFTFPTAIGNVSNIKKAIFPGDWRGFIVGNDGKLYMSGRWTTTFEGGFPNKQYDFEEYTYNMTLSDGEKFIDVASFSTRDGLALTDKGRLFGFGKASALGIGRTDDELLTNRLIESSQINGKKITQIVSGKNLYIAVDEDGKVYGTGENLYGVLGRWAGAPRSSGRYRTAFDWVECPELEN